MVNVSTGAARGDFVIATLATSFAGSCCVPHCPVWELKTSWKASPVFLSQRL
jgi:hypothetical protein